ncbi:MAG: hypothetical protein RLZZ223_584, partial [Candidatus Parcubacteria bacterium]
MDQAPASFWKKFICIILDILFTLILFVILTVLLAVIARFTDIKFIENLFLDLYENAFKENYSPKLFDYCWILSVLIYAGFPYSFLNNTIARNILGLKLINTSGKDVNRWLSPYRFILLLIFFMRPILLSVYILFF